MRVKLSSSIRTRKAQSAMEYLMTYGWAILIIAVVLAALFHLGVFSGALAPRAQPGACKVIRPQGPDTSAYISLQGVCTSLLPLYVAQFNGYNSYINLGNSVALSPEAGTLGNMTLCIWSKAISNSSWHGFLIKGEASPSNGNVWEYAIGTGLIQDYVVWSPSGENIATYSASTPDTNRWHFTCFTYDYAAQSAFYYEDGVQYAATFKNVFGDAGSGTGYLILGRGENGYSNVELSNFQIYNTSLSSNELGKLYAEGIGGVPVRVGALVGWWPLNGNANDTSGNLNNGAPANVAYTSSWTSSYSLH